MVATLFLIIFQEFIIYAISGKSYMESLKWIKSKTAIINPKNNNDSKCFQYAITVPLNYEQIKKIRKDSLLLKPV